MALSKRTKIVATLGPASTDPQTIRALIQAGVNVFRLNFSHGNPDDHRGRLEMIRAASSELGVTVGVLQDLQGPKIRCGRFKEGAVELQVGQKFTITSDPVEGDENRVSTTYRGMPNDVEAGQMLLLDDGNIRLKIDEVRGNDINTTVVIGGRLSNNKGINIPGADLSIPALTDKDVEDLAFGAQIGVDWVAISFVRSRDDLLLARHYLNRHNSRARLMAKIEKPSAVSRFDEILEEADGVMVARGDLGVEMPLEQVPAVQKRIILKAVQAGKAVITATQMLESMIKNPGPTRAEASDVANAIFDGTDAIMLSAETASGMYPVEAVSFMTRVAQNVEGTPEYHDRLNALRPTANRTVQDSIALAVDEVVQSVGARAVVVFTSTGGAARRVARFRPPVPILACTPNPHVTCQLALVSGVLPIDAPDPKDTDDMVKIALEKAKETGLAAPGEYVVIAAGVPFGVRGTTNMLRVERVS